MPALGRWKQKDQKFKVFLSYMATPAQTGPVSCDGENVLELAGSNGCILCDYLSSEFFILKG